MSEDEVVPDRMNITEFNRKLREKNSVYNLVGGVTDSQEAEQQLLLEEKDRNTPWASLTGESTVGIATGLMYPVQAIRRGLRQHNAVYYAFAGNVLDKEHTNPFYIPPDPNWSLKDKTEEIRTSYPQRLWGNFQGVQSEEEYQWLRQEIDQELEDSQFMGMATGGMAAQFVAGTIDPLVFTPLKWSYTGHMAQKGLGHVLRPLPAIRARGIAYGVGAGVESAVASTVLQEAVSEDGNLAQTILPSLAFGLAFGSVGGAVGAFDSAVAKSALKLAEDYRFTNAKNLDDAVGDGVIDIPEGRQTWLPPQTSKAALRTSTVLSNQNPSAGAMAAPANTLDLVGKVPDEHIPIFSEARQYIIDNEIDDADMFELRGHPVGNWLYKNYAKLPWLPDAHTVHMMSGSAVHRMMAHQLFSGGTNVAPNVRNADIVAHRMMGNLAAPSTMGIKQKYLEWASDTGTPKSADAWRDFNRQVRVYAHELYWGRDMDVHPAVKAAVAEGTDVTASRALEFMQDVENGGARAVAGSEGLEFRPGWLPLRWQWKQMQKALDAYSAKLGRRITEDDLIKALSLGYKKAMPGLSKASRDIWARAVLRRSRAMDQGIDTNLMRSLQQNGEEYVKQMLRDNGLSSEHADKLVQEIRGMQGEKNVGKILRHRNEIDLNTPIGDTGLTLMDLTEPDVSLTMLQYSRHAAHLGANARAGYQLGDIERMWEIGNIELRAKGLAPLSDKHRDFFVRAASGNAVNDVNPWVRRAVMTSNLTLLNSQGLTQMADTGAAVAHFGVKEYVRWGGKLLDDARKGNKVAAMEQISELNHQIRGENMILQPERYLDDFRRTKEYRNGLMEHIAGIADPLLVKGNKLQAVISGFEAVHMGQHALVAKNFLQQFSKIAAGEDGLSKARLEDMGFYGRNGEAMMNRLTKYFKADKLPDAPANGFVRMYHGGSDATSGGGRWVSQDLKYAQGYAGEHGKVWYVDVPESHPSLVKMWDDTDTGMTAPYAHVELPEDITLQMRPYEKQGVVEFGPDGEVLDLHPEKWDMNDWQDFGNLQYHMSNQLTLKILNGERSAWQSSDVGYLFSNLRTFNLAAMQKMTMRNLRIMDAKTTATAMYTLSSAALVVMARDAISGREERMSTEDITRAALSLGSFTGGPSIGVDTLGAILGIDALRVSPFRQEGPVGTQVLPEIVALTQLEKMAHIPTAVYNLATGQHDKRDITALQSLPLIGNLYGFTYMWNRMKADVDARKREEKREAKKLMNETATRDTSAIQSTSSAPSQPVNNTGINTPFGKVMEVDEDNLKALQEAGFLN